LPASRAANGNVVYCQGEYLQEMTTQGVIVASQDLGLTQNAGSITLGLDGHIWFGQGVAGKIGMASV
jgi:hypothetical protein